MLEFKHLLIPVDGSATSAKAARAGIEFAGRLGAKVTVYYAVDPLPYGFYAEGAPADEPAKVAMERRERQVGKKHVEAIAEAARSAGVSWQSGVEAAAAWKRHERVQRAARAIERDEDSVRHTPWR